MLRLPAIAALLAIGLAAGFAHGADAAPAADKSNPAFALAAERTKAELAITDFSAVADRAGGGWNDTWGQIEHTLRITRDAIGKANNSDPGKTPSGQEELRKISGDFEAAARDLDAARGALDNRFSPASNLTGGMRDALDCLTRFERDAKDTKIELASLTPAYQALAARAAALKDQAQGAVTDLQAQLATIKQAAETAKQALQPYASFGQ